MNTKIKTEILWFVHNAVSHPIYGLLKLIGMQKLAQWAHDITVPEE